MAMYLRKVGTGTREEGRGFRRETTRRIRRTEQRIGSGGACNAVSHQYDHCNRTNTAVPPSPYSVPGPPE